MIVEGDSLNCSQCLQNWKKDLEDAKKYPQKRVRQPRCWEKDCRNSKYQLEGIDEWLMLLNRLRSSEVIKATGLGRELLEWCDGLDQDTLETLCVLESMWNELEVEKQKRERN